MNYYQFHIGDYISHTSHLSDAEDIAYRRMLDLYYMTEMPLPDAATVARRVKSTPEIVQSILSEFFIQGKDGWRNKRCDAEIDAYQNKISKASAAGRASVAAKKANKINGDLTDVQRSLNACSTDVQLTNNHKPITNNQEPINKTNSNHQKKNRSASLAEFDLFWNEYPRRVGKGSAVKAFERALTKTDAKTITDGLDRWKRSKDFPTEERFIPHAATWLNAERWLDIPAETTSGYKIYTEEEKLKIKQETQEWLKEWKKSRDQNQQTSGR